MSDDNNVNDFDFLSDVNTNGFTEEKNKELDSKEDTTTNYFTVRVDPIKSVDTGDSVEGLEVSLPLLRLPVNQLEDITNLDNISGTDARTKEILTVVGSFLADNLPSTQAWISEDVMKDGDWHQGLLNSETGRSLHFALINAKLGDKTDNLSVTQARTAMDLVSGLSGYGGTPVYSGLFIVRLKRPTLGAVANLFRRISTDKRVVGLSTSGAGYSCESVYLDQHLIRFVADHIASANIKDYSPEMLPGILTDNALDELLISLLAMMHQKGFKYARACVGSIEKCTHVERGTIGIAESHWVDNKKFTDEQKEFIHARKEVSLKDLKAQQGNFILKERHQRIDDQIDIVCKMAYMDDKIAAGERWIKEISDNIDSAFQQSPSQAERIDYLNEQMDISNIAMYVPFIEELHTIINDETNIIKDQDAIRRALVDQVGVNNELLGKIGNAILRFQALNQISVWGTPNYTCPSCSKVQVTDNHGAFGSIIPHGVKETFLSLGKRWKLELQHQ